MLRFFFSFLFSCSCCSQLMKQASIFFVSWCKSICKNSVCCCCCYYTIHFPLATLTAISLTASRWTTILINPCFMDEIVCLCLCDKLYFAMLITTFIYNVCIAIVTLFQSRKKELKSTTSIYIYSKKNQIEYKN